MGSPPKRPENAQKDQTKRAGERGPKRPNSKFNVPQKVQSVVVDAFPVRSGLEDFVVVFAARVLAFTALRRSAQLHAMIPPAYPLRRASRNTFGNVSLTTWFCVFSAAQPRPPLPSKVPESRRNWTCLQAAATAPVSPRTRSQRCVC